MSWVGFIMKNGLASLWVLILATSPVLAQTSVDRFERQMEHIQREQVLQSDERIPAEQRALFDYGGFAAFNFFAIDDLNQSTHILRQTDLSGYARLNFDDVHEIFIRGLARYEDFNSGDSFDNEGDDLVGPRLKRAFYRFNLQHYLAVYEGQQSDLGLIFTGGRQLAHWATGLTLDHEFDGITLEASLGDVTLTGLAGVTVPETLDFDSSRPNFDDDTRRGLFGGRLDWQVVPEHKVYVYGLVQRDYNQEDFDPDPLIQQRNMGIAVPLLPTRYEYDSHYIGFGSQGNITDKIVYGVEAVYEGGDALSSSFMLNGTVATAVPQTSENISAFAFHSHFDYLFHDANRTRATLAVVLASGDNDRLSTSNTFGGNRSGTDDHAFNALGLIYTGVAFAPQVSNLLMVRGGVSTFPLPEHSWLDRLQIGANVFVYNKLNANAPINEPTGDQHYLGTGLDMFVNWQLSSDMSLAVRYGVFFPGTAIQTDHDARHFLFTGFTYAF